MKSGLVKGLVSAVCLAGGAVLWTAGRLEQRIVSAERTLLTMQYDEPAAALEDLERSTASIGQVPWIARLRRTIAEQRAHALYWKHDYRSLATPGEHVGEHMATSLLAANAAFRRLELDGSDARAVERLQEVAAQYAELLRGRPDLVEAAYNYEFVARTREALARARGARARVAPPPPARTLHGQQGATPTGTDMGDFKVIIPQNPQERQQRPESGSGAAKVRKG